jgi:hypothetical protein
MEIRHSRACCHRHAEVHVRHGSRSLGRWLLRAPLLTISRKGDSLRQLRSIEDAIWEWQKHLSSKGTANWRSKQATTHDRHWQSLMIEPLHRY